MSTTIKTVSALGLALLLSLALFASPIGISRAQEDDSTTPETTTPESADETRPDRGDRGDRTPLTDEERAALEAERDARKAEIAQALADELGVTVDELTTAFRNVALAQVQAALDAGEISQERAAAITERIESGDGVGLPGFGFGDRGRGGHGGHGPGGHDGPADDASDDGEDI